MVERPDGSLDLLLELLELLLGGFVAQSYLLRELFCLGLLRSIQLLHLFLTRWHKVTSLRLWLILFSFFRLKNIPVSMYQPIKYSNEPKADL
jgi:hypothetical protein